MNFVMLIGNACDKPELKKATKTKTAVARFRIAVSRPTDTDTADFFTIVCFGRTAEIASDYITKGRRFAVQGHLHHSIYETEAAEKRTSVEVIAQRIELLGGRS